jgi:hypothetical protein
LLTHQVGLLHNVDLSLLNVYNDRLIQLRNDPLIPPNNVTLMLLRNGPLCLPVGTI